MAHWSLATFREQYLFVNENSHPLDVLDTILMISKSIGHQFFGNVVTCRWWDMIWLNEGFATAFGYLLPEIVYPEMRFRDYFNVRTLQNGLLVDAHESWHAMTSNDTSNDAIINDKGEI